jgi:hypothetical protein
MSMRIAKFRDMDGFFWDGDQLRLRKRGRVIASIEPDPDWPGLWRVGLPDGSLSDMVNRTRAKDAARSLALAALNRRRAA